MKKTKYFLALLAAVIVLTTGIGQTMAYFTTYTEAKGHHTVKLGDETKITEEFTDWTKVLTITSEEGSEPVFVRAKVFYNAPGTNRPSVEGEGWSTTPPGGELTKVDYVENNEDSNSTPYYYFENPVIFGTPASALKVNMKNIIPADVVKGDTFHVIVIYESTPVLYNADGEPYADWNSELKAVGTTESRPNTGGNTTVTGNDVGGGNG